MLDVVGHQNESMERPLRLAEEGQKMGVLIPDELLEAAHMSE
jgi:hypothetical protein